MEVGQEGGCALVRGRQLWGGLGGSALLCNDPKPGNTLPLKRSTEDEFSFHGEFKDCQKVVSKKSLNFSHFFREIHRFIHILYNPVIIRLVSIFLYLFDSDGSVSVSP